MTLFEQMVVGDDNDLDQFGMDAMTRKRLKVKTKMTRVRKKPMRKLPTKLPRQLAQIEDVLSERVWFSTLGAKGKGTNDPVGFVTSKFFHSTPELERSLVDVQQNRNGWILQGSWPSSGQQVFDWELETWGERGGAVVVKFNMWSAKGRADGQNYRTTVGTVNRLVPKFLKKVFRPAKAAMKKEVGAKIGMREESKMSNLNRVNELLSEAVSSLKEGVLVPFATFHKKRLEKMGRVKVGPKRFALGDSVKIGKSKPREVLDINKTTDMVMLGAIVKKKMRGNPYHGMKYLFWDDGAGQYYMRAAGGASYSIKDTPVKPEDITVVKKTG